MALEDESTMALELPNTWRPFLNLTVLEVDRGAQPLGMDLETRQSSPEQKQEGFNGHGGGCLVILIDNVVGHDAAGKWGYIRHVCVFVECVAEGGGGGSA